MINIISLYYKLPNKLMYQISKLKLLWIVFTITPIVYLIAIFLINYIFDPFKGFMQIQNIMPYKYLITGLSICFMTGSSFLGKKIKEESNLDERKKYSLNIIRYILHDMIAIGGLVLFLCNGGYEYILLFVATIILQLMAYPEEKES